MDFKDIDNVYIPEGGVTSITDSNGIVLWKKKGSSDIVIPNNEIHYRTSNLSTITLYKSLGKLISNTYNTDGSGGVMVFENDITKINNEAFRYIKTLTAVTLPSSVTSIGDYAFANCSNFRKLYSQNTIKSFGTGAFFACIELNDVVVNNSVTSIGDECFAYCGFNEITLPNSLKTISVNMLYGCDQLKAVTIGNSVSLIQGQAFAFCYQLRTITCLAMVAPTITYNTFNSVGTRVPEGTPKILRVPQGATGYESWLNKLEGWEIQYITE